MRLDFPAWDPVLFDLPGPIDVRWYGLMYIAGFAVAGWILGRLARDRFVELEPQAVGDFLVWCLFGVILGGRLGYALFYDQGLADPVRILEIWKGGMSFHGGLLGVFVAFLLYAKRHGLSWLRLGDAAALIVTPGIAFVRFANFINGELYGRKTTAESFLAMRFPTDGDGLRALGIAGLGDTRSKELAIQYATGHVEWDAIRPRMTEVDALGRQIDWEGLRTQLDWQTAQAQVDFRFPSQLFEGLAEGVLLGLVLWLAYRLLRPRHLAPGGYGGLFLAGYGVARFLLEYVRQPDAQFTNPDDPIGTVFLGLTMGQTLSSVMVLAGLFFLGRGFVKRAPAAHSEPQAAP